MVRYVLVLYNKVNIYNMHFRWRNRGKNTNRLLLLHIYNDAEFTTRYLYYSIVTKRIVNLRCLEKQRKNKAGVIFVCRCVISVDLFYVLCTGLYIYVSIYVLRRLQSPDSRCYSFGVAATGRTYRVR